MPIEFNLELSQKMPLQFHAIPSRPGNLTMMMAMVSLCPRL